MSIKYQYFQIMNIIAMWVDPDLFRVEKSFLYVLIFIAISHLN